LDIQHVDRPVEVQIVACRYYTENFVDNELHVHDTRYLIRVDVARENCDGGEVAGIGIRRASSGTLTRLSTWWGAEAITFTET
jgi:hypothetical protein